MRKYVIAAFAAFVIAPMALAQSTPQTVYLYKNGAPGFEDRKNIPEQAADWWVKSVNNPSITVFLPDKDKATGTGVVILPGGGHRALVYNAEGVDPANFFQKLGVAAFVVKYRLAREEGSPYTIDEAGDDARRAMRTVRSRAAEWGVDPTRLGLMGWSAGGELSQLVTFQPCDGDPKSADPIERQSCRPDFLIEIYPGPLYLPDQLENKPPPAFFLASNADHGPARTITRLLDLYRVADVPAEVHLYAFGAHAFNMGYRATDLTTIHLWPGRLQDWMQDSGLLTKKL